MEKYYAITRSDSNDELQHWKYIKRVKGKDGKYKYYYDLDQELTKYKNGTTIVESSPTGTRKTTYKQTNDWLDSKTEAKVDTFTFDANSGTTVKVSKGDVTYSQGKISRAIAKGEKWIFDNLISDKKKAPSQRNKKKTKKKQFISTRTYTETDRKPRKPLPSK